jgi:hypothetical protein
MEEWGNGRVEGWGNGRVDGAMEEWKIGSPPFPIETLKAVLGLEGGGPECVSQPAAGGGIRVRT